MATTIDYHNHHYFTRFKFLREPRNMMLLCVVLEAQNELCCVNRPTLVSESRVVDIPFVIATPLTNIPPEMIVVLYTSLFSRYRELAPGNIIIVSPIDVEMST